MALLTQGEVNELLQEHIPVERAWDSTVNIVVVINKTLRQHGSGSLYRVGTMSFLITAAHVIEQALKHGCGMGLSGPNGKCIAMTGDAIISNETSDVSVVRLSDDVVEKLRGSTFLTMNDICFTADFSQFDEFRTRRV